jgi:hypothetical protein
MNYLAILHDVLNELLKKEGDQWVCTVYKDEYCESNAIVGLLELDGSPAIHEAMKTLHDALTLQFGYPVSISHNSPTDGYLTRSGCCASSIWKTLPVMTASIGVCSG